MYGRVVSKLDVFMVSSLFCLEFVKMSICKSFLFSSRNVFMCFVRVYILHHVINSLCRADKGQTLKTSYIHYVDRPDGFTVAAEMTHRFSSFENRFTIGSSQFIDPKTVLKTRFSDDGKAAFQCQRAWRPNSLITLSAEYDSTKIFSSSTKFGLALSLKP